MPLHVSPVDFSTLTRYLTAIECFALLDEPELGRLVQAAISRTYSTDEIIFQEGEIEPGLWVIEDGGVKIFKLNMDGGEQILHLLGPGDYFNLVGALDGGPNPAHAASLTLASLWFIPSVELRAAVSASPVMSLAVIDMLTGRLRRVTQHLEDLTLYPVKTRLARFLLSQAMNQPDNTAGIITRADIAGYLGTTAETVSRTLVKLQDDGAIRFDRHRVIITDAEKLRLIAFV
jgi:CRP/FNR family transcriptional regulator, dissimilatory nitrate respiration regulator